MAEHQFRPIPTEYGGYTFRSRTEARWAVFLDAIDVRWDYEREGFEFNGQRYLPDFWMPHQRRWLEIKGTTPTYDECEKAKWLAEGTGYDVLIAAGEPCRPVGRCGEWSQSMWIVGPDDLWDSSFWWCECPVCGELGAEFSGRAARLPCRCIRSQQPCADRCENYDTPLLADAYAASRRSFTGPGFRGRPT